jgi:hypothetical protein
MENLMMEGVMPRLAPPAVGLPSKTPKRPIGQAELLAAKLERAIRRATGDRVRNLRVWIEDCRVSVSGRCGSFYCKQQASQAAIGAMRTETAIDSAVVDNQIEVW